MAIAAAGSPRHRRRARAGPRRLAGWRGPDQEGWSTLVVTPTMASRNWSAAPSCEYQALQRRVTAGRLASTRTAPRGGEFTALGAYPDTRRTRPERHRTKTALPRQRRWPSVASRQPARPRSPDPRATYPRLHPPAGRAHGPGGSFACGAPLSRVAQSSTHVALWLSSACRRTRQRRPSGPDCRYAWIGAVSGSCAPSAPVRRMRK
jgi:hypothetical protein